MEAHFRFARSEGINPVVTSRMLALGAIALYEGFAATSDSLRSLAGQLNALDSLPRPGTALRMDQGVVAARAGQHVLQRLYREARPTTLVLIDSVAERQIAARRAVGVSDAVVRASLVFADSLGAALVQWADSDGFAATRGRRFAPTASRAIWVNETTAEEFVPQDLSAARDYVQLQNPAATRDPTVTQGSRAAFVDRAKTRDGRELMAVNPTGATEPFWGTLRPFVLRTGDECAPPAPATYSEARGAALYSQATEVYRTAQSLTSEQRQTAFYWADSPGQTATPAGHWIHVMAGLVRSRDLSAERAVELFALGAIAQADAFISCWRAKYATLVVRPITYVRRVIDSTWHPLLATPPFPEFPSGHSVQSGATAEVLTRVLGAIAFTDSAQMSLGHAPRTYPDFWTAAREAAVSRLYGGIHFRPAIELGLEQGRCIGRAVRERLTTRR